MWIGIPAGFALQIAALLWLMRGIAYLVRRFRGRQLGDARRFLVAPICGVIVLVLGAGSVPLRARWALSQSSFGNIVHDVRPTASPNDTVELPVPERIGLYRIDQAFRTGDGVIFYESTGGFIDFAGFAYLPSGPFPELRVGPLENPSFQHLSGDWYAWTASW